MLSRACYNFFMTIFRNRLLSLLFFAVLIPGLSGLGGFSYSYAQENISPPIEEGDTNSGKTEGNDNTTQNVFIAAIIAAGAIALASALTAQAAKTVVFHDFGGRIVGYQPICAAPPGILINLGPPTFSQLMYLPTTLSFFAGPPRNPGQQLLGRASMVPVPCLVLCPIGLCPHPQIGGLPILFHGSSLAI